MVPSGDEHSTCDNPVHLVACGVGNCFGASVAVPDVEHVAVAVAVLPPAPRLFVSSPPPSAQSGRSTVQNLCLHEICFTDSRANMRKQMS